mgnify:CR=1 FL=1
MRKDELVVVFAIIIAVLVFTNVNNPGSFGFNEKTAEFLRSIFVEFFTGFVKPAAAAQTDL